MSDPRPEDVELLALLAGLGVQLPESGELIPGASHSQHGDTLDLETQRLLDDIHRGVAPPELARHLAKRRARDPELDALCQAHEDGRGPPEPPPGSELSPSPDAPHPVLSDRAEEPGPLRRYELEGGAIVEVDYLDGDEWLLNIHVPEGAPPYRVKDALAGPERSALEPGDLWVVATGEAVLTGGAQDVRLFFQHAERPEHRVVMVMTPPVAIRAAAGGPKEPPTSQPLALDLQQPVNRRAAQRLATMLTREVFEEDVAVVQARGPVWLDASGRGESPAETGVSAMGFGEISQGEGLAMLVMDWLRGWLDRFADAERPRRFDALEVPERAELTALCRRYLLIRGALGSVSALWVVPRVATALGRVRDAFTEALRPGAEAGRIVLACPPATRASAERLQEALEERGFSVRLAFEAPERAAIQGTEALVFGLAPGASAALEPGGPLALARERFRAAGGHEGLELALNLIPCEEPEGLLGSIIVDAWGPGGLERVLRALAWLRIHRVASEGGA